MTPKARTRPGRFLSPPIFLLIVLLSAPAQAGQPAARHAANQPPAPSSLDATSSLLFVQNEGQWAGPARYQAWLGANEVLWVGDNDLWLTLLQPVARPMRTIPCLARGRCPRSSIVTGPPAPRLGVNIRISFPGANQHPTLVPIARQSTHVSYFIGNKPSQWRPDVPVWGGVEMQGLYPGVDLLLQSGPLGWQPTILVNRASDLGQMRMEVQGGMLAGLSPAAVRLTTALGSVTVPRLGAAGQSRSRATASIKFRLGRSEITIPYASPAANPALGAASGQHEQWATLLGAGAGPAALATGSAGSVYVAGIVSNASTFPTTPGAFQTSCTPEVNGQHHCQAAYDAELDPTGRRLIYATFIAGKDTENMSDSPVGAAVDAQGDLFTTGLDTYPDYPTTAGALQPTCPSYASNGDNCSSPFVTELNPTGTALVYSTFLGGSSISDGSYGLALTPRGEAVVTGEAVSPDFPVTTGSFMTTCPISGACAFVAALNPSGTGLAFSTLLGGAPYGSLAMGVHVDGSGITVAGATAASTFPLSRHAYRRRLDCSIGICESDFVLKLSLDGGRLIYSTLVGSSTLPMYAGQEPVVSLAVDARGDAYITGNAPVTDEPTTPGAFQRRCLTTWGPGLPCSSTFVAEVNPTGTKLIYSTYLGGAVYELPMGIAVDRQGEATVVGLTQSYTFPTTAGTLSPFCGTNTQGGCGYITRLNAGGTGLIYSTVLSYNAGSENVSAITQDTQGAVYIGGWTYSTDFPVTPGAFQTTCEGDWEGECDDQYIMKLDMRGQLTSATYHTSSRVAGASGVSVALSASVFTTMTVKSLVYVLPKGASAAGVTLLSETGLGSARPTVVGAGNVITATFANPVTLPPNAAFSQRFGGIRNGLRTGWLSVTIRVYDATGVLLGSRTTNAVRYVR